MTKIDLHIDTEESGSAGHTGSIPSKAANKVGLLSTITVSAAQLEGFASGYGCNSSQIAKADNLTYSPNAIRQGKNKLKNIDRCSVLAVTGGLDAYKAIFGETNNPPFVCLVGEIPDLATLGNCSGGISTNAYKSNKARAEHIAARAECELNEVGLYYNPNSGVKAAELADWNSFNTPATAKAFSGGLIGPPPTNDPSKFADDFAGALFAGLKALVISADPFFQANMEKLILAANSWTGFVCYPLQDYKNVNGTAPKAGKSTLYGPDLVVAYTVLGALAQGAAINPNQGFFVPSNLINNL